jgi:hypothetical protein
MTTTVARPTDLERLFSIYLYHQSRGRADPSTASPAKPGDAVPLIRRVAQLSPYVVPLLLAGCASTAPDCSKGGVIATPNSPSTVSGGVPFQDKASSVVEVCVDPAGRFSAPPRLVTSSGDSRFDKAAIEIASRGEGHITPAKCGGKPVASCAQLRITFSEGRARVQSRGDP